MKKTFAIILALAAAGLLASRTKDEGDFRSLIQGDWVLVRTTYTETTNGVNEPDYESGFDRTTLHYVFGEKNQWTTFNYNDPAYVTLTGSYKLRGNKLTITIPPTNSDGEDERHVMTVDDLDETTLVLSYTDEFSGIGGKPHIRRITHTYKKGDFDGANETKRLLKGVWQVVDGSIRVVKYGEVSTYPLLGEGEACIFEFDVDGTWKGLINCSSVAEVWDSDNSAGEAVIAGNYIVRGNRLSLVNGSISDINEFMNPYMFLIERLESGDVQLGIDVEMITYSGDISPNYVKRLTLKLKKHPFKIE